MALFWEWRPLISVGPVRFGMPLQALADDYPVTQCEELFGAYEWDTYKFDVGDTEIYVEGGIITSVGCFDELFYDGNPIFGLSIEEIRRVLGPEDEIGDIVGDELPVEYDRLGLQLWIRPDDEIAVAAICSGSGN